MGGREQQQWKNLISEDLTTEIKLVGAVAELRLDVKYLMISSYFSDFFLELLNPFFFQKIRLSLVVWLNGQPRSDWQLGDGNLILIYRLMVAWILAKKGKDSPEISLNFHQDSISHLLERAKLSVWYITTKQKSTKESSVRVFIPALQSPNKSIIIIFHSCFSPGIAYLPYSMFPS